MGNSVSKAKTLSVISIGRRKSDFPSSTTSSSERTLVEEINHESADSKSKKKKPSILPNSSFFNNARTRRTKESKPTHMKPAQNYHHASVKKTTVSRKKPKTKKKANITKSIIGKPTNFKHLNSSTSFNGHGMNANSDEEDAVFASQMIALTTMIKPLPGSMSETPIIPPRTSSYGNEAYLKSYSIPSPSLHAPCKPKKNKRSAAATPSSIKKSRKNQVKYVSIGKTSMTHKRVHHSKMPREPNIV